MTDDRQPQPNSPQLPLRCLTIDVEEYFHIEAAHETVSRAQWDQLPWRVEENVDRILSLLDQHKRRGTFFVLGWVARRHPAIARRIVCSGHEIASHGTNHDRLHRLDPDSFREDLTTSRKLLEDQTGHQVKGYRAPTFSVVRQTAWAIDVLVEAGFVYDASIFPVVHPSYGVPDAPARPYYVQGRPDGARLLEVPPLTWRLLGRNLAVAGGGYFRLLPPWFMKCGLKQADQHHRPAVLYFHPWEFDPQMPRMPLPWVGRIRTYTGLNTAAAKLKNIIAQDARWVTIGETLDHFKQQAQQIPTYCLNP